MATSVSWNGSTYSVPASGERAWGASLSAYLVAIASGALSKAGGSFSLTSADVDWGATYGHKAVKFASRNTPATTGIFRLGNDEAVSWRNAANSADLALKVNSSNVLQFNGSDVLVAGAASIVNADISASAAIAYSKLAALTASRALVSDGSGFVSASAVTSTELGYVSGVTSALQTQLDAKQPLDSDLTAVAGLSSTGLIARTDSGTAAVRTVTAGSNKVAVTNGDGVSGNPTVDVTEANLTHNNIGGTLSVAKGGTNASTADGALTNLLPTQTGNSGKVLKTDGTNTSWVAVASTVTTTRGDLIYRDASADARLAIGSAGKVLRSDGTDPSWADDFATAALAGRVSTTTQTFAGVKTFQDGLQLPTTGGTPSTLDYYQKGTQATTFTSNGTSGGTSASVTCVIQRIGDWVTVFIPAFNASSGTGSPDRYTANSALPSWARPASASTSSWGGAIRNNNAVTAQQAFIQINTSGIINVFRDPIAAVFTTSANAGLNNPASITYFVGTGS